MNNRSKVDEAADRFAEAIKLIHGNECRVGVFFCYLEGVDFNGGEGWVTGARGNMNQLEMIGAVAAINDFILE